MHPASAKLGASYHTVNAHVEFLEGAFCSGALPPITASDQRWSNRPSSISATRASCTRCLASPMRRTCFRTLGRRELGRLRHRVDPVEPGRQGPRSPGHYLRTSDGYEIDLIVDIEGERWAIEVKLTTAPTPDDVARLGQTATVMLVSPWSAASTSAGRGAAFSLPIWTTCWRRFELACPPVFSSSCACGAGTFAWPWASLALQVACSDGRASAGRRGGGVKVQSEQFDRFAVGQNLLAVGCLLRQR